MHPERELRAGLPVGHTGRERRRNERVGAIAAVARVVGAVLLSVLLGLTLQVGVLVLAVGSNGDRLPSPSEANPPPVLPTPARARSRCGSQSGSATSCAPVSGFPLPTQPRWRGNGGCPRPAFAFGLTYVLLSWALEASNSCARSARELRVAEVIRRKPHISALVRYLHDASPSGTALVAVPGPISRTTPGHLGGTRALAPCSDVSCPWNIALLVGAPLSGLLGSFLAESPSATADAAIAAVCLGGAIALCRQEEPLPRWLIATGVAAALLALGVAVDAPSAWATPVPWLAISSCYTVLRSQSYLDSMGAVPPA